MMPREAIIAVYERGTDAVVELVEDLSAQLADQQQMIASLTARLDELEDRLAKNSRNSSKPPSSDGISKPKPKSLRRKSGKKPGGQKGHPGTTLSSVENPEHVVLHGLEECEGCGRSLSWETSEASGYERRQVVDVPVLLALEVTEHRAQRKRCFGCGTTTTAPFPVEVSATVAYGSRIKALMVYLMEYQLLPYERASELLSDLFGEPAPGAGTLYSALERCFEGLEETEEAIKEGLRGARVAHFDETGLRVEGEGKWVHVASTDELTHYAVHEKRGVEAMEEIGILPSFEGVAVHDGLSGYRRVLSERCLGHALCNAHHLRELRFVEEEHEQEWAGKMKELLLEIEETVREEADRGGTSLAPARVEEFEVRYQRLLLPELNLLASAVDSYESPEKVANHLGMSGRRPDSRAVYAALNTRLGYVLDEELNGHLTTVEGRLETVEALRQRHRLSEVMIRNRKSQVGGFQPRQAFTWPVEQTAEERAAYAAVEEYVREGYQKALETQNNALGFVMVTFQKLMASSSRALRTSLIGRRARLLAKLASGEATWDFEGIDAADGEDASLLVEEASSDKPQFVSSEELQHLDELIERLELIHEDSKARALLSGVEAILKSEPNAKILIFTQFRETQEMLNELLGRRWSVYLFHGQIGVLEKDRAIERFRLDKGPSFLISTEAGGEGRNLQFCHLLVNYDLPWNPMRVEQRIGRVDRIGQKEVVTVFNFSVAGTVEERVLDVLERRIGLFTETVGGLDPILGEVETDLRRIFQMAESEAKRALEMMANSLEKRMAEARKAEVQLADFIMDSKSFRPDIAHGIMEREKPVSRQAMHDFAKALLKAQRTILKPTETEGVYEAIFREPFLSDHPDLVQDGGHKRLVCFDPTVAADSESVQLVSFGHQIVEALVDAALDNERGGLTAVRHIHGSDLTPGTGYQFNFILSVGGINPRKEVFSVYVNDEGESSEELGRRLLDIEAQFNDERGDNSALDNMENLDAASSRASLAAALALERLAERTSKHNHENLKRERTKLERYFDYRDVVAGDKAAHARRVVTRIESSEDPSDQRILPVWRANLENAIRVRAGLADEKTLRLAELDRLAMPETGFSLLGAARVVIHPRPQAEDDPEVETEASFQ